MATLWLSGMIEQRLTRATHLDANLRVVLAKFIKAILIVVGVLVALEQIGFDLTLLTVFGGALGVGIGLGLQKLASNYIAGFTILLDRSIRLGDMITVDSRTGVVTQGDVALCRRAQPRRRRGDRAERDARHDDGAQPLVLVAGRPHRVQVQVTYDSDVEKALTLLTDVALREPRVLRGADRRRRSWSALPTAASRSSSASGSTIRTTASSTLKSALNRAILKEFAANGIQIPFPRRDVRIVGAVPDKAIAQRSRRRAASGPSPSLLTQWTARYRRRELLAYNGVHILGRRGAAVATRGCFITDNQ